jgi:hypothetical protein
MTTWTISRWSKEWVGPIEVEASGITVTDWTYAVLAAGQQPASATAIDDTPQTIGSDLGVLIGPGTAHELSPGRYLIWVRYVANPEAPVINDFGTIVIT